MEHPVTIITDHKNLGHFKQPQNLTQCQAWWKLFLQDFDIIWGVEQGINMGPADTLSRKDEVDTLDDNWKVTLLKGDTHYHHIWQLNATLANKIASSSTSNPIVTKALSTMNDEVGEHWLPCTSKEDWVFEHGSLYFKNWLTSKTDSILEDTVTCSIHKDS